MCLKSIKKLRKLKFDEIFRKPKKAHEDLEALITKAFV